WTTSRKLRLNFDNSEDTRGQEALDGSSGLVLDKNIAACARFMGILYIFILKKLYVTCANSFFFNITYSFDS
ncbi:MAG: hypothetical protein Q4G71_14535, partial [Pseudomonadota bacterium]|nr:hypothetical protein [Pseudomonadota bacterium]